MAHKVLLHKPHEPLPSHLLEEMHRVRHRVFRERLCWEVGSFNGMERDCYDLFSPVYAVSHGETGRMNGCWRLLPTTGPYLLRDVFADLLHGQPVPHSPRIWEASRFAFEADEAKCRNLGGVTIGTAGLVAALLEFGLSYNIEKIVAVSDLRFERILKRTGLLTQRFGPPRRVGDGFAVSGWFDVTEENLGRVRQTNLITKAVLDSEIPLDHAA